MKLKDYISLCESKEYLNFKSNYYRNYNVISLVLVYIISALWIVKDLFFHNLYQHTDVTLVLISFRILPSLIAVPVIYLTYTKSVYSTICINFLNWLGIAAAFIGIHYLTKAPYYFEIDLGWVAFYVMFYALSTSTHHLWIYPLNTIVLSVLILVSDKTGYIICPIGSGTLVATCMLFSIPLAIVEIYLKINFAEYFLANKKIEKLAKKDALTGAWNRFRIADITNNDILVNDAMIVLIDVDDFKNFNTIRGHSLGDIILVHTVLALKDSIENGDAVIRYGGDEFVIYIESCDSPTHFYNRLMHNKSKILIENDVTYSIGISFAKKGDNIYDKINEADTSMYNVKNSNKDGFKIFE